MTHFFDQVPPHILVALALAMLCIVLDAIDIYRLPPEDWGSFGMMSKFKAQEGRSTSEESENEKRKTLNGKIYIIRMRVTVFSILFAVFAMNMQVVAHLLFDVTLGWIQNALITIGPVAVLTYALESIIKMGPDE